jgi:hypothetical protein
MTKGGGVILNTVDEVTGDWVNYTSKGFVNINQREIYLKKALLIFLFAKFKTPHHEGDVTGAIP